MSKVDELNTILVQSAPKGVFEEFHLDGAAYPGIGIEVKAATEPIGEHHTAQAYSGTDGHRKAICILLENELVGRTCEDQISDGQMVRGYFPVPGEKLLIRVSAAGTGTGDSFAIGDKLILSNGGTFIATTGTPEAEPFEVLETISDVDATGDLVLCMFTGN